MKAPSHLSSESQDLWRSITHEFVDADTHFFMVLQTALEARDRMQEARRVVDAEGAYYTSSTGMKKAHPALTIEREARSGFLAALRLLGLNLAEPADVGRPPGT